MYNVVIQTYFSENHESLQGRGEDHEERWWKVAYDPKKEQRVLCHREGWHTHVNTFDNVSLKIRERYLVKASREQEVGDYV